MWNWQLFRPKAKPAPVEEEPVSEPSWLKIWLSLRKISVEHALAGLLTIPVLLFFAISGVLAWLVLAVKFVIGIYNVF